MIRKKIYTITVALAALAVLATGCGNAGKPDEAVAGETETAETAGISSAADAVEASSMPVEGDTQETESTDESGSDDILHAYADVLDMFYYKITGGWDQTEDVSYMFYWSYTYVHSLSDAGYMLTDMNGDGMPELLVSTVTDAADGLIYDLYTCVDGEAVHAASSGERYRYCLNEDNDIFYWASSGASNNTYARYGIDAGDGALELKELVRFDSCQDKDSPWFYSTEECFDKTSGYDYSRMTGISEEEARQFISGCKAVPLDLTLFSSYSPQGDMPASDSLRMAFRSAMGSETELDFVCDDFDGDGTEEAFGITGEDDGINIHDLRLYFITPGGQASCTGTLDILYAFGGGRPSRVMDTGNGKFLVLGGADGQETWLYGVRDGQAYQPEVSGKYAEFRMKEDGGFFAQSHEGGEGYYIFFFDFDPVTGEFIEKEAEP